MTDVMLPNGNVVPNVAEGATQREVIDRAIREGLASPEDFNTPQQEQQRRTPESASRQGQEVLSQLGIPVVQSETAQRFGNFLRENMEIPVGITGSLAGGVVGLAVGGPIGGIVGAVAGGAAGSAGGSLLSDELAGEDLDYARAVQEALISAGFDVALLGAGKIAKPLITPVAARMQRALGFSPKETAESILSSIARSGGESGTRESLAASQQILQRGTREGTTATLTQFQTRQATPLQSFGQTLGDLGLLSSPISQANAYAINKIVQQNINDLIQRAHGELDPRSLGSDVFSVVDAGRKALQYTYGQGLEEVMQNVGRRNIPFRPVLNQMRGFLQSNSSRVTRRVTETVNGRQVTRIVNDTTSDLDNTTREFIEGLISEFKDIDSMSGQALINFEKKLMQEINKFSEMGGPSYNSVAARTLSNFSREVRDSITTSLNRVDSRAATRYRELNRAYSSSIGTILPPMTEGVIKKANQSDFDILGRLLVNEQNTSKISAFMRSIDESFRQIDNLSARQQDALGLTFATAADAKIGIRASFMKNQLPDISSQDFDIRAYRNLARQLNTPGETARLRAILGPDYPTYRQLINLMEEASETPGSNIGQLVLRSREYQAAETGIGQLSTIVQAGGAGVVAGAGTMGMGVAGTFLLAPVVLAKISHSPRLTNRLLAFGRQRFNNNDVMALAAANLVADVMKEMTVEEQAEMRNMLSGVE